MRMLRILYLPTASTRHAARRRAGFTIIELLVSIGVIAILASILFPVISLSRRSARQAICLNNLRQWDSATVTFYTTNGGYIPRRGQGLQPTTLISRPDDWFNALPPILKQDSYYQLSLVGKIPRVSGGGIWICP